MHSTMDMKFGGGGNPGEVWANCYVSSQGGIESFRVVEQVQRMADELIALRGARKPIEELPNCPTCGKSQLEFQKRSTCGFGGCPWGGDL